MAAKQQKAPKQSAESIQKEKEQKMKDKIESIETDFFKQVSENDDLEAIKARGNMAMSAEEETMQKQVSQK